MNARFSVAIALFVAGLVPSSVFAAAISIDDTAVNDTITVGANDFEYGLSLNGALFQQGLNNPASVTLPETTALGFHGTWITIGQQPADARTIYLVETPYDPAVPTAISDTFFYQITPNTDGFTATINAEFRSDYENNLGFVPAGTDPRNVFVENGTAVSLGFYALSIYINSDVPEPATLGLLACGLLVLRRRAA